MLPILSHGIPGIAMTENRRHRQLMPSDDTVDTLLKTTGAVFWAVCDALKRGPLQRSRLINLKGRNVIFE
jgi:hypothetical protein